MRVCAHRVHRLLTSLTLFTLACVHTSGDERFGRDRRSTLTSFGRSGRRQAYFDSMAAAASSREGATALGHNAQY